MSKKIGKKIWIYVGVGVFLVIVGIISWGVATDWKFIGGKKSGGSGPPPPPPSPPCPPYEDPCDPTKCKQCSPDKKKCILCYNGYTLNDGICVCQDENKKSNNCCPKGSTRDNAGSCCPNNRLTTTGDCCNSPVCPFGNIKVCCDGVDQKCDNDGKGCYISCGSEYCYNGGKCVDDGNLKYCENKDCKWESIPSTNPSYISDITIKNFPECGDNPKCTKNSNGTYTLNTTGITTPDNGEPISDSQGNPYTFIYKPSYGKNLLPKKYKMVSEITAPKQDPNFPKKCDKDDCNNILNIFGNGTITNDMPNGICKMRYDGANVMDFPKDAKCPFENDPSKGRGNPALRCCPGLYVETSGQICPEGTVGAMKNANEEGGMIFECVSVEQCVDDNGKICGGNGYCQYDPTLNKGFCKCDDKYGVIYGSYCQPISQFKFTTGTTYTFNFYPTGVYVSCYDITKDISAMDLMTKFLSKVDTDLELVNDGMIYYIETNDKSYRADTADSTWRAFTNIINSDCVYNGKCISTSSGGVAWTNQLVGGCSDNSKSNCNQCPFTVSDGKGTWNSNNSWDGTIGGNENFYKASWVVVHKKNTNQYALINIYRWFINADYYIVNQTMSIDKTATTFAKGDAYQYHFLDNTDPTKFTYDKTKIYFTPTSAEKEYNYYLSAEEAKNDRNKKLKEEICKTTQKK